MDTERPHFDPDAARMGLALLKLQARAADPALQPGWVNRRVQQLAFLDTRAVRWRVSIDFQVPQDAPTVRLGDQDFYLVPVTSMAKTDLVAFDLRDEAAAALWMPTSQQTTDYLAPALVYWASQDLRRPPQNLPRALAGDLRRIVSDRPAQLLAQPPALLLAAALIDARHRHRRTARRLAEARAELKATRLWRVPARLRLRRRSVRARREHNTSLRARRLAEASFTAVPVEIRPLAYRLMASAIFRSQVEELAQNYVVHVGASTLPGSRRIIKLSYESEIRFARPMGRFHRLWQSLGWRPWQVDVLIGGRGGSHHLEVAAPPGVDVVGITADPAVLPEDMPTPAARPPWRRLATALRGTVTAAWWRARFTWQPDAAFRVSGYAPHVHINPPGAAAVRFRAAIFVRVSRPGWLTSSWLIAVVITAVIVAGRLNLATVYSKTAAEEAGTAATLLLALLAVFATLLVRPGEHPLASRLLLVARLLILVQAAGVLLGVGNLVLHNSRHPVPFALWTGLAVAAGLATTLFTVSWLAPVALRPHRE
jgi:tryptophan-rich sensory protein